MTKNLDYVDISISLHANPSKRQNWQSLKMLWTLPPTAIEIPSLDLRPVTAVIERDPGADYVNRFKTMAAEFDKTTGTIRLHLAHLVRSSLASLAAAELDGWHVDVSGIVKIMTASLDESRKQIRPLKEGIRLSVARLTSQRIQGAKSLHDPALKIYTACDGWMNDLEDYIADFSAIERRMKTAQKMPSLISRAETAYRQAFERVFGHQLQIESVREDTDSNVFLRLIIPVKHELLADSEALLKMESRVHDAVGDDDQNLVGHVVLDYREAA